MNEVIKLNCSFSLPDTKRVWNVFFCNKGYDKMPSFLYSRLQKEFKTKNYISNLKTSRLLWQTEGSCIISYMFRSLFSTPCSSSSITNTVKAWTRDTLLTLQPDLQNGLLSTFSWLQVKICLKSFIFHFFLCLYFFKKLFSTVCGCFFWS